jgi:hypothetical protein
MTIGLSRKPNKKWKNNESSVFIFQWANPMIYLRPGRLKEENKEMGLVHL